MMQLEWNALYLVNYPIQRACISLGTLTADECNKASRRLFSFSLLPRVVPSFGPEMLCGSLVAILNRKRAFVFFFVAAAQIRHKR